MMAKRGRPTLAATSLDAAIRAVYIGTAPKRPRNDLERQARGGAKLGRKPDPQALTRQAAEAARYMVQWEGISMRKAAARAAEALGVNAENVRQYARTKVGVMPMVVVPYVGESPWLRGTKAVVPILGDVIDESSAPTR